MASLWIRSGYDVKVEVSAQTYQVGAHFKAFNKAVLVAPLKTLENFFSLQESVTRSEMVGRCSSSGLNKKVLAEFKGDPCKPLVG